MGYRVVMPAVLTRLALGAAGFLVGSIAAGVAVTESSIRIGRSHRIAPGEHLAEAAAVKCDAVWEPVEIAAADGIRLRAWLLTPRAGASQAVLVQHGLASNRHGILSIATMLLRNGYRVLTPDSRGHGASGGDLVTFGIHESEDMRRWSQWLRETHGAKAVYALGESLGAATALQSLGERAPFEAVVAECPFAAFPPIVYYRLGWRMGLPQEWTAILSPVIETAFAYTRLRYRLDLRLASPLDAVTRARVPILLIHGVSDVNIPPEDSRRLAACNRKFVELWEVPGAGHADAFDVAPVEFERRVLRLFRR